MLGCQHNLIRSHHSEDSQAREPFCFREEPEDDAAAKDGYGREGCEGAFIPHDGAEGEEDGVRHRAGGECDRSRGDRCEDSYVVTEELCQQDVEHRSHRACVAGGGQPDEEDGKPRRRDGDGDCHESQACSGRQRAEQEEAPATDPVDDERRRDHRKHLHEQHGARQSACGRPSHPEAASENGAK
eukprot:CAMPEP_0182829752 /NCGR_PEP_ID=MMETSP0006_2-20121128/18206_1 /TAXON_ID=97485 /ORGANISM="Prymnesium parvum, Strain Texoma1" /LENGTH=184 /DNA_ID=CAMNT_0024957267 /DNA_START=450 /DNA_END=1001 /DNA_ORIENTATION=+